MDCLICFDYYDGYMTEGMIDFDTKNVGDAGSTKHWASKQIFQILLTKDQFCSKGEKDVLLAKAIIEGREHLSEVVALRSILDSTLLRELKQQYQAPMPSRGQRLQDLVATNSFDLFIFVQYYNGIKINGMIGFSACSGPHG
eukprot:2922919-Ditylum_brightwellii.AAC.1